ncbi:MAG: DUF5009 domain-containing protein [Bacteroidaceae bacterium]|nr:DUF5009 domain-containing protein [Bacteroidaceae bacterium]
MKKEKDASRIASIDLMRALTMTLMLFVNDIPGLKGVPLWLFHAAHGEDMLGFSDTIFPAFLFCVGLSIPFALERRIQKSQGALAHVLWRSFALIVMGLFTLNGEMRAGNFPYPWYSLLMIPGFFLVWLTYDRLPIGRKPVLTLALRTAGVLLLLGMMIYSDIVGKPFRTGWWGILGLIGWSYLVCALTYLLFRRSTKALLSASMVGIVLCVANSSEWIPYGWFSRNLLLPFIPGGWTHHALCLAGMAAAIIMRRMKASGSTAQLMGIFVAMGIVLLGLGWMSHQHWIISKIQATPTWLFFCLALYFPLLALLYWVADVRKNVKWFEIIMPAGRATLTCYLLPYLIYALRYLTGLHAPGSWNYGLSGLALSLAFALITVQVVRLLIKAGVTVKL